MVENFKTASTEIINFAHAAIVHHHSRNLHIHATKPIAKRCGEISLLYLYRVNCYNRKFISISDIKTNSCFPFAIWTFKFQKGICFSRLAKYPFISAGSIQRIFFKIIPRKRQFCTTLFALIHNISPISILQFFPYTYIGLRKNICRLISFHLI